MTPRTIIDKIWDAHVVSEPVGAPSLIYIDLHLVHEVTSPQAFEGLRARGIGVRRPDLSFATVDHSLPTTPIDMPITDAVAARQIAQLQSNCEEFRVPCADRGHPHQGIVHVIGPELGLTQPGMTIVCGDSHTATHGAFGALAFGIGTSEVEMVLASQCLLQRRPRRLRIAVSGRLPGGVSAKDLILAIVSTVGVGGGTGHVIEYAGEAIRTLSMEQRMTLCNMSIEAGARAGLVAPDDTTIDYLAGRPCSPLDAEWEEATARWRRLPSDDGATFDREVSLDATGLAPMITFGTNPGMAVALDEAVPAPASLGDAGERRALEQALAYMKVEAGRPLLGQPVDVVFIGSCTNGRLSDLRDAAAIFRGRRVAAGVRAMVVPGSRQVKRAAEAEGLDRIFTEAGAEWREPGCSMCIAMNGDQLEPGQLAVSTSNRNFEGRQGPGGRTLLASPATAAAAAVTGVVTDPRRLS
ncbi:MAG TPA: 3-isopropylmalate dehydratase large subunit [Vicinamibacterales bacterium]|jgi:3-isopropylmalate/(R)-2-methylmalate dehydratase large subunit